MTDEATARKVQLAIDYDPRPPFGRIEWDRIDRLPRLLRGGISLVAPLIAAGPRRLTRRDRRAQAGVRGASAPGGQ